MNIMLGNLGICQIESRLGINFPDDLKEFMKNSYQANANNIGKGKWHCFDMPFHLVCGDVETAKTIYNHLKDQSDKCNERLRISIQSQ